MVNTDNSHQCPSARKLIAWIRYDGNLMLPCDSLIGQYGHCDKIDNSTLMYRLENPLE